MRVFAQEVAVEFSRKKGGEGLLNYEDVRVAFFESERVSIISREW